MDDVTTQRSTAVVELVDQYTRNGLVKKCETRGLSTAGTKLELAARIVEHDTQSDEISSLDVISPISTQVLLGMDFLATKKFSITNEGVKIVGFRNDEMSNHEEDEAMTKKWINKIEILSNELDVPKAHCEKR
uniref:SAP domain-containing protein n=1 Tax=Anopheles atroparvus TaxID=41427 RepID=A0A182J9C3_ANOAO